MKLRELKEWIAKLPEDTAEFDVVMAVIGQTDDKQYWYRKDDPLYALDLDKDSKEVLFMRYTTEKVTTAEIDKELDSTDTNENADS